MLKNDLVFKTFIINIRSTVLSCGIVFFYIFLSLLTISILFMIEFFISKLSIFISKKNVFKLKRILSLGTRHILAMVVPIVLNENDKMSDLICKTMKYLGSFINNQKKGLFDKILKKNKRIYIEICSTDNMNCIQNLCSKL